MRSVAAPTYLGSPTSQSLCPLSHHGSRLVARTAARVGGTAADPAGTVRPMQSLLVQATRGYTFRRHYAVPRTLATPLIPILTKSTPAGVVEDST